MSKVLSLLPPHNTNPCTAPALLAQPLEQLTGRYVSLGGGWCLYSLTDIRIQSTTILVDIKDTETFQDYTRASV